MRTSPWLRRILTLDPERDAQQIVRIDTVYEFPFDTTRSLELALSRTFGSPNVSRLLDETREFALRAQRRYDDTDLILSTIVESGYDSEDGRRAIRGSAGGWRSPMSRRPTTSSSGTTSSTS